MTKEKYVSFVCAEFCLCFLDFSPWGQFIASIIAIIAVAIFAIPTGVLGAGFIKAVEKAQNRQFTVDLED